MAEFLADRAAVERHLRERGEVVEVRESGFGIGDDVNPGPRGVVTLAWLKSGMLHAYAMFPYQLDDAARGRAEQIAGLLNGQLTVPGYRMTPDSLSYTLYAFLNADGSISSAVIDWLIDTCRTTLAGHATGLSQQLFGGAPPG